MFGFGIGTFLRSSGGVTGGGTPVPPSPPAPSWTVQPSISGTPTVGQTLTGNDGTISNGTVLARSWLRNGSAISGANGGTYLLDVADEGASIAYRVSASGTGGSNTATSATVGPIAAAPVTPTAPPADWRMPATVATSSGLSGSQAALTTASASAASKSRPVVTIPDASTQWIEWTAGESGEAILSFIPRATTAAYAVTVNGVDQGFTKAIPEGTSEQNRRQAIALTVTAGQAIRLTITTSGGACDIEPLLHRKPDSGPWDAHLLFGPSLLQTGYQSSAFESSILTAFPTRDPVCFNYARTSYTAGQLAAISDEAVAHFGDCARYAWCGGLVVNDAGNDVPNSGEIASLNASLTTIFDNLEGAGLTVGMGSTRYLAYSGTGAPDNQSTGSRAYDSAVVIPFIASRIPGLMEPATARPRYDEYLLDLYRRDLHSDYVHGSSAQYALERAEIVAIWHRYIYTGVWSGYTPQIEQRISMAETDSTDQAKAVTSFTEAGYAVLALDVGTPRSGYQARLDAIEPTVLFFDAKRLITIAELSTAPLDKSAAQAALDAAVSAGFIDMAAPNTVAAQQARINAIVGASFDQIIQIEMGNASPGVTGWNGVAHTGNLSAPGITFALVDSTGASTGVSFVLEAMFAAGSSVVATPGSTIAEFPDPHLRGTLATSNASGVPGRFTGLDPAKTYDLVAVGKGNGAINRRTALWVNGVSYGDRSDTDLLSNPWRVTGISPTAGGEIDVDFKRGTSSTYTYAGGLVLKRHA